MAGMLTRPTIAVPHHHSRNAAFGAHGGNLAASRLRPASALRARSLRQRGCGGRAAQHAARAVAEPQAAGPAAEEQQPNAESSKAQAETSRRTQQPEVPNPAGSRSLRGLKFGAMTRGEGADEKYYVEESDGTKIEVMFHDYGFRSGHGRLYQDSYGKIPASGWALALENFAHEYRSLRRSFRYDEWREFEQNAPSNQPLTKTWRKFAAGVVNQFSAIDSWLEKTGVLSKLTASKTDLELEGRDNPDTYSASMRDKLAKLQLSVKAVDQREKQREATGQGVKTPWFVRGPYVVLCWLLDVVYPNRPIQRFWFLETVARMPYFSYISMLHLYETLGWWRAGADLRKVHFAEEWNELHHLQIMESLGGDELWVDRFIAQHAAVFYYYVLLLLFWVDPETAYNFSELIEAHAVDTYGEFADANEEVLKTMPPPLVALQYYRSNDTYMFDEFQTAQKAEPRRPSCRNLHDVFINIRDDEGEHVKTMRACQNGDIYEDLKYHARK